MEEVYSEVYEVLSILGSGFASKIPVEVLEEIDNKRNKNSIFNLDISKSLDEQDLSSEAIETISYLYLTYICSENERKDLMDKYKDNEYIKQKNILNKIITISKLEDKSNVNNLGKCLKIF